MADRDRPLIPAAAAAVLVGQVVVAVVRDAADARRKADHERFYGVDRTPRIPLASSSAPRGRPANTRDNDA